MKGTILKRYGLTAKCYLDKFNTIKKGASETFVLFSSKLKGLLNQYLESRDVKDYNTLVSLLISDCIKETLPEHCLKRTGILSVESTLGKPFWFEPHRLVQVIDEYMSNLGTSPHVTSSFIGHHHGTYSHHFSVQNANQAVVQNGVRPDFGRGRGSVRLPDTMFVSRQCGSLNLTVPLSKVDVGSAVVHSHFVRTTTRMVQSLDSPLVLHDMQKVAGRCIDPSLWVSQHTCVLAWSLMSH